jgi:hypothetical protein
MLTELLLHAISISSLSLSDDRARGQEGAGVLRFVTAEAIVIMLGAPGDAGLFAIS